MAELRSVLIELDGKTLEPIGVSGVDDKGNRIKFNESPNSPIDQANPPKVKRLVALSAMLTNPCHWVLINGKWYWVC